MNRLIHDCISQLQPARVAFRVCRIICVLYNNDKFICLICSLHFLKLLSDSTSPLDFSKDLLTVHASSDCLRKSGPRHHELQFTSSAAFYPLLRMSARIWFVGTCLHCSGSVPDWISPTLSATKTYSFLKEKNNNASSSASVKTVFHCLTVTNLCCYCYCC